MDLGLYLRVLWRFRVLVGVGIAISVGLAFLTHVRVDFDGAPQVSPRSPVLWGSTATVLITERGFPWGASALQDVVALQRGQPPKGPQFSDPGRFTQLALLYTRLARSDDVRAIVTRKGAPRGASYSVTPEVQDGIALPILAINAWGRSPEDARNLARLATDALRSYIANQQATNAIPDERRVRLDVIQSAQRAKVISRPSKVKPMFVFVLGVAATFVLAFALENLRPRRLTVDVQAPTGPVPVVPSERKTA